MRIARLACRRQILNDTRAYHSMKRKVLELEPSPTVQPIFKMPSTRPQRTPRQTQSQTRQTQAQSRAGAPQRAQRGPRLPVLDGPVYDGRWLEAQFESIELPIKDLPKAIVRSGGWFLNEQTIEGVRPPGKTRTFRCTVSLDNGEVAIGDGQTKRLAQDNAYLHAGLILHRDGLLVATDVKETTLSNGSVITVDEAKAFMTFYCARFKFPPPLIQEVQTKRGWEATMTVNERRIGMGRSSSKKTAQHACYLDVVTYLEKCDPELWKLYKEKVKTGDLEGYAPSLFYSPKNSTFDSIRNLIVDIQDSSLYKSPVQPTMIPAPSENKERRRRAAGADVLPLRNAQLSERRKRYLDNPQLATLRTSREELPVFSRAGDILSSIEKNDVTILMAATGSGKTTQVPQLILDSYIDQGRGSECNILCTQPRRLAALSVADRVAQERGETKGQSVGYQVRFEHQYPEENGSITFLTIGIFLRRMQGALEGNTGLSSFDNVTHIVVDEVHERDVDTDLLLVVLRRWLAARKAQGNPVKVILMSATIDPTLFQEYFKDSNGQPAEVLQVPGRSFPVEKHFMDDFLQDFDPNVKSWLFRDESVCRYLAAELEYAKVPEIARPAIARMKLSEQQLQEPDIPFPLVAATISHVWHKSNEGHILVFLPGWEDIVTVQKLLLGENGLRLGLKPTDYELHLLHSSIPLKEQQRIFERPKEGVRRIILSTNIAETSVTIPDVVYVVDAGRLKEQRYDPERRVLSLVSAWVGSSNLNQRAGRAGRHRSGDYYGVMGRRRADSLTPYQTVEINRVDLTNVAMHIKALNFPGLTVENVLAETIEPPQAARVSAAMESLRTVGALDEKDDLTSLGRVLLQLPVDVNIGRLILYGVSFRCLDAAVTLAAIMGSRDPFMAPISMKEEATRMRAKFIDPRYKSDQLTILRAFKKWEQMDKTSHHEATRFCIEHFLSKPTMVMMLKVKQQIVQSLWQSGVMDIALDESQQSFPAPERSGRDSRFPRTRSDIPLQLNENCESEPLLTGLIALASQPQFAIRVHGKLFRTQLEKTTMIHGSSVNHSKFDTSDGEDKGRTPTELYSYTEKRRNLSSGGGSGVSMLAGTSRIEPLTYALFGAHKLETYPKGLKGDHWITIAGNLNALEDVEKLRHMFDKCMLRVYESIALGKRDRKALLRRDSENENEADDEDDRDLSLSKAERKELSLMTRDIVQVLDEYSQDRLNLTPRPRLLSRVGSPMPSERLLSRGVASSHGTPYMSRANTPLPTTADSAVSWRRPARPYV